MMLNYQTLASKLSTLKIAFVLSLGLATTAFPVIALSEASRDRVSQTDMAQASKQQSPLADGVYLYGQSPKPEQIGQEYLVFKVQQNQVIGAIYLPQSEFNCFSGTVDAHQMNLSIVDPHDNAVYPFAILLESVSPVASSGNLPRAVGLEGYHQISNVSDSDRRILDMCLKDYSLTNR
jgi:hypothetical protein